MDTLTDKLVEPDEFSKIINTFGSIEGYTTIPYVSTQTGIAPLEIEKFIEEHPERIRKSLMQADNGVPLYTLNTPMSAVWDAWNAVRYINFLKTE